MIIFRILCTPGWTRQLHTTIRERKSGEIVGFYSAMPCKIKVYDK